MYSSGHCSAQQKECQPSKLRICRFSQHSHEWCDDWLDYTHRAYYDRQPALNEYAEFKDADDMIQQLNSTLSKPHGSPPIPAPRKACQIMTFEAKKRHSQYVMCPEQDCENLVYFSDQTKSMIETLGLQEHPFWKERVEKFYQLYHKLASRTSKDAWTWEEGKDTSTWSSTRGASNLFQEKSVNSSQSS